MNATWIRAVTVRGQRFSSGRVTQVLLGPGAAATPQHFVMGRVLFDPHGRVPAHVHSQEETYYVVRGTLAVRVGNQQQEIEAPGAVYIPPGVEHAAQAVGEAPAEMLFVYAPSGIVAHWAEELGSATQTEETVL